MGNQPVRPEPNMTLGADWQDEDFVPEPEPPLLCDVAAHIREQLRAGTSYLDLIEDLRLFTMARLHQAAPATVEAELTSWGLDPRYAADLVTSTIAMSGNDGRARQAKQMAAGEDADRPANPGLVSMVQPSPWQDDEVVPHLCPGCNRVLYPVARLRPLPALSLPGRILLFGGYVLSGVLYLAGFFVIGSMFRIPTVLLALFWCPIALIPALVISVIVKHLPRVLRIRCRGCGYSRATTIWSRRYARPPKDHELT